MVFLPGGKGARLLSWPLAPSRAKIKNEWHYTSVPSVCITFAMPHYHHNTRISLSRLLLPYEWVRVQSKFHILLCSALDP